MKARINYNGGAVQQDRMNEDKLRSLKKAMLYSYQAATAVLEDGREFRCLINPDKLKTEYRDKIISIPFKDVRVGNTTEFVDPETGETIRMSEPVEPAAAGKTSDALETIGLKIGDVFEWKEDKTYWLVYLRYEEERAYFRAEIRNCDYEIIINGKKYRGYMRGPDEDETLWRTKHNISWVDVDYTALLYVTSNEDTRKFFHRFQKLEIYDKMWEVQVVDPISNEGLLMVALKETYRNELEEQTLKEIVQDKGEATIRPKDEVDEVEEDIDEDQLPRIVGPTNVYPYDKKTYKVENITDGYWLIDNEKKAVITHQSRKAATVDFYTGRSGEVSLTYKPTVGEDIVMKITINSL